MTLTQPEAKAIASLAAQDYAEAYHERTREDLPETAVAWQLLASAAQARLDVLQPRAWVVDVRTETRQIDGQRFCYLTINEAKR